VLDKYFLVIVLVVIFLSVLPTAIHIWNDNRHEIFAWVKARLRKQQEPEV